MTSFNGVSIADFGGHAKATWMAQFHQAYGRLLELPEHAVQREQYDPEAVSDDAENLYEALGSDADPKAAAHTYLERPGAGAVQAARRLPGYNYG